MTYISYRDRFTSPDRSGGLALGEGRTERMEFHRRHAKIGEPPPFLCTTDSQILFLCKEALEVPVSSAMNVNAFVDGWAAVQTWCSHGLGKRS